MGLPLNVTVKSVMDEAYWEHFEHEADIGVRGCGATLAQAFEQAALGLTAVICPLASIVAKIPIEIDCHAPDAEILLVDWLNAIIFEMSIRKMLFSRFVVTLHGDHLHAVMTGEAIDVARHQPAVEVKGATYTLLSVRETASGQWVAQCVVDV